MLAGVIVASNDVRDTWSAIHYDCASSRRGTHSGRRKQERGLAMTDMGRVDRSWEMQLFVKFLRRGQGVVLVD